MQSIREKQSRIVEEERRIDMLIKYEREAATKLAQEIQVIYFFLFFSTFYSINYLGKGFN